MISFSKAPGETPLVLVGFESPLLAEKCGRLGVHVGDTVMRLDDEALPGPTRIRSSAGEAVLAAGMAAKVIVLHDDGHATPVSEMAPGEQGRVVGLICGSSLERGLAVLGVRENDRVEFLHRLPPMEYHARLIPPGQDKRLTLSEGAAAKIWGEIDGHELQFAVASRGKTFLVKQLLGGVRAVALLEQSGVAPGRTLILENVAPAQSVGRTGQHQLVLRAQSGLRLHLREDQAASVLVRPLVWPLPSPA
jgi:Fe2+ transport system protein FeoA